MVRRRKDFAVKKTNRKQNELSGKKAGRPDPTAPAPVRPHPAGLQRHREGTSVVERNRGRHGEVGGRGEAEMEEPARQVLQSEEANGEEKRPAAGRRAEPGGAAGAGAVRPAGLAQRVCQTQSREWPRRPRRSECQCAWRPLIKNAAQH